VANTTMVVSLVGNELDPILSIAAAVRKALYQRTVSVSQLLKSLALDVELEKVAVIALSQLALPGVSPRDSLRRIVQAAPEARIVLIADSARYLFPADKSWLEVTPNVRLWRELNVHTAQQTGAQLLTLLYGDGDYAADLRRMGPFLKALVSNTTPTAVDAAVEKSIDYERAALALFSPHGVAISNRRYRLTMYPEVFLAREASAWMQRALKYSKDEALLAGQAMQDAGLIYHVVREQAFAEEDFFFRLAKYPTDFTWASFLNSFFSKDGPARKNRTYHTKTYPLCLQGQEVFDWMRTRGFSENEAMTIGQRMIDLNIIHHVADEQPFRAANLFFRACHDEIPVGLTRELSSLQQKPV
jgi:Domain found in Dishevelled, Egl-10, and Pleckstrin (DEP)